MAIQTILYFASILLTFALTGWLAWYAWRHSQLPGASAYARLALSECLWALAEILSVLSPSVAWALFWFQVRYLFGALIGVFWFVFALEYNGHKDWFSKRLLAGLFIIPFITQALLWSNSLHGLWVQHEATFIQNGPFWIADITARIPGLGYLMHSFYILFLTLAGIALMLLTAWKMRREFIVQALMLAGAGLTAFFFVINSLFNLLPKMEFNPFTPGLGLSVLLIALAVFRFQFLKRAPAQESAARRANLAPLEKRSLAIFILSFILFASGLAAVSYLTYQDYEKQFRAQIESQISAIAALKVDELHNWRTERLADAEVLHTNPALAALTQKFFETPEDAQAAAQLRAWLDSLRQAYAYDRVFLLDTAAVERIASPAAPEPVATYLTQQVGSILKTDQVTLLDFHRDSSGGPIHLALLVPIYSDQARSRPLGVLILRISPDAYLNSFIQRWPVPSASAETLLVRREGEQVVYLNQLRFKQETALNLRFPLAETHLPATRAVLGETGVIDGVDYRGQAVIADIRAVPDSPWFLVSKMDTAEVLAPLRERLWQTLLFFCVLVLAAGAGLVLAWRQQQVRFYRAQVETMQALRASEEKFRLAFDTSTDSVVITRLRDGMFVSVNRGFEQISGYTREEVVGKTSAEINIWKDSEDRRKVVEGLRANGAVRNYEAPFLTREGEIYGLMSAVIIELNGEPHILNITRDISERKQAEKALRESEERFRRAVLGAPFPIMIHAEDGEVVTINTPWTELTGYNHSDIPTIADWTQKAYGTRMDLVRADIDSLYALAGPKAEGEYTVMTSSGKALVWDFSSAPIGQLPDGRRMVISMAMDVTERKLAEDALKETERAKTELLEKLNAAQKTAMVGSWEWDLLTDQVWWSDETYRIFGVTPQDFVPSFEANGKFIHPDDFEKYGQAFDRSLQTGAPLALDLRLVSGDGVLKHCHAMGKVIYNDAGQALRFTGTIMNITERKQAEEAQRQSELLFRTLFELSPDAIVILDPNDPKVSSPIIDCNAAACLMNGYQRDELIGQSIDIVNVAPYTPDGQTAYLEKLREVGNLKLEVLHRHKSGLIFPVEVSTTIIKVGQRELVVGIDRDITERKRAEEILRESERKLREAQEMAHLGFWFLDVKTGYVEWSEEVFKIFGLDPKEFTPQIDSILALSPWPEDHQRDQEIINRAIESHDPGSYEQKFLRPDQSIGHYYSTFQGNYAEDGELISIVGTVLDITERKRAEEKLVNSETHYRRLFEAARDGILILDAESGVVTDVNAFMIELLGFSHEVFLGKKLWELGFFKDIAANQENYRELLRKDYIRYEDLPLETAQGRTINVEFVSNVYQVDHHRVVQCNIRNITERVQAEEALRESEDKFKHVFEYSTIGKSITQFNGGMQVNQALCDLLGYSMPEMQAKKWQEITHPDDIELTQREIDTLLSGEKESVRFVKRFIHKDGTIVWVDLSSSIRRNEQRQPLYLMSSVIDITERKRAEEILQSYSSRLEAQVMERTRELRNTQEQLVRQERLATLGQLAGSIGHELRNPLGVISNAIYYLKMSQPEASDKVKEYLDIIEKETRTSNKIVTDLLDFTRIKSVDRESASVSELVRQTLERYPAPPSVQVTLEIPADLPQIYADPQQVVQVLGNLLTNACQAMATARSLEQTKLTVSAAVQSDMICIGIQDTGPGIPPENIDKLFQPLFTTKTKGIGLGLAVSKKLVEANGGRIEVESVVGQGSTFTVYLPVYKK